MSDTLPSLTEYANGKRHSRVREFAESKIGSTLIIAGVLFLVSMASGVASLPAKVDSHDKRIGAVENETRALRESAIRKEEQFSYIVKQLDQIASEQRRQDRRR